MYRMSKDLLLVALILRLCGSTVLATYAGPDSILGKWQVAAETPDGPLRVEFNFTEQNGTLSGSAWVPEGSFPMSAVNFDGNNFTADLVIDGDLYKLRAALKEGTLIGEFERTDGQVRGTWTAERVGGMSTPGLTGTWNTIASTPQGDLAAALEIRQDGEHVSGQLSFPEGSVPIQSGTFRANRLQFDVVLGSSRYRTEATVAGDRMTGVWNAVYGDENGAFSATRRPKDRAGTELVGTWMTTAITPIGDITFELEVKETDGQVSGSIHSPEGSMAILNPAIASNRLSFEVDYMGGRYRLELAPDGEKLRGSWGAVGGGETGPLSAERK